MGPEQIKSCTFGFKFRNILETDRDKETGRDGETEAGGLLGSYV